MTERLPPQPNEWIDRSRPLEFKFEGQTYTGFAGDTVTSALAAKGLRLLGRSFKYHRARGVYSLANHDVNVLVELSLIHISEPTRLLSISYAVFCLKKK